VILDLVSLLMLGVVWGASLVRKGRSLLAKYHWQVFFVSALVLFSYATYEGLRLYKATYEHPIGKFFDIEYFLIFRVGVRIFAPYLISFLIALLFMWVATRYNKKYDERFFEKEEIQLGGLSMLLVGHPGWIIYFPLVILTYLLIHILYQLIGRRDERIPLYHLWVPIGIFVILISKYWISDLVLWSLLKI